MPAQKIDTRRNSKRKSNLKEESVSEKLIRKLPDLTISEKSGEVLTIGQGDVGQLGLGDEILERKRPQYIKEVDGIKFTEITCGGMHSVAVTDDGQVYTWGCNDDGALGRLTSGDDGEEYLPRKVTLPEGVVVVNVSAGDSHSAAITTKGEVFAWGSYRDTSGIIGLTTAALGQKNEVVRIFPTAEDPEAFARKIASGNDHTVILTDEGVIYTNGSGEQGQLGRVKECFGHRGGRRGLDKVLSPQIVRLRKKVFFSDIFCGSFCTFALSRDDSLVYAWGLNNYGQLGNGNTRDYFNPEIMRPLSELRESTSDGPFQISAGQHHTILVDGEGKTYCIGRAEYGRLGLGNDATETALPIKIPALSEVKVTRVACGEAVSFAITNDGHLYSWGIGTSLQLGVGDEDDISEPTLVKSKNINPETDEVFTIDAGGQHTSLLARKKSMT